MSGRYSRGVVHYEHGEPIEGIRNRFPSRVKIAHPELGILDLPTFFDVEAFAESIEFVDDGHELVRLVSEGEVLDPDTDEPRAPKAAAMVKARLLGKASHLDGAHRPVPEPRWLIEGIWQLGTSLQLSGNSKAGKTFLLVDLIFALLVPGWLFLGKYARGNLSVEELRRHVVMVNTEHPADDLERALAPLADVMVDLRESPEDEPLLVPARSLLTVYHLRELDGGVRLGDLFTPATFEAWVTELTACDECDGEDDLGPLAVIFDNGTAVMRALQINVQEHNGEFQERFRDLLDETGALSGLYVSHARDDGQGAYGGTLTSAASDGEMYYYRTGKSPRAPRKFALSPRGNLAEPIPDTTVIRRDGRLFIAGAADGPPNEPVDASEAVDRAKSRMRDLLSGAGVAGLWATEVTGKGDFGKANRPLLEEMRAAGEVIAREQQSGRARGTRYWLAEFAPPAVPS